MKKLILILVSILLMTITGCEEVEEKVEEGTLYTKEDIFIDCIKIDYPEAFTSKMLIIEDDNALETAFSEFPKLSSLPGFDEIVEGYPIDKYIYVVQFMPTGYEHETITFEGIVVDKEDMTIRIKAHRNRKKNDTFGSMAGYITYAVFPKEELSGCNFSEQPHVLYPGK